MRTAKNSFSEDDAGRGTPDTSRLRTCGLILAAVLLAYANALLWGVFQFDDYNVIIGNPRVHSWAAWWADFGVGIRPLLKLSYTLDWRIGDGAVLPFHLTNLAIHGINALLVLLLTRHFASTQARLRPHADWIAACTALLFALHPIHSETVTYISGRSTSLMALFYLLGLLAYVSEPANPEHSSLQHAPPARRVMRNLRLHLLVPLCFLLALAVKETAVTFPFALLLWALCTGDHPRNALRQQWSSWLLLVAGTLYFLLNPGYAAHLERSATFNDLGGNLASTALGTAWLLRQWVAPFWLNIDPDLPVLRDLGITIAALPSLPSLLLLLTLTVTTGLSWQRRPWLAFALAWLLLQLVPLHLVLPRLDVANERQMLLAGWPLAMVVASELALRVKARATTTGRIIAAALLLCCLVLTIARNLDYRSEIALWEATARQSPDKARAHNNLGYAYAQAGRNAEARAEYQRALQLDAHDFKARHNLKRLEAETANRPPP